MTAASMKPMHLLQDVLLPHEIEWLEKQQHRPNAASQVRHLSLLSIADVFPGCKIPCFRSL